MNMEKGCFVWRAGAVRRGGPLVLNGRGLLLEPFIGGNFFKN